MITFGEPKGIREETVVDYFKILSWDSPWGIEENHGELLSGLSISWSIFEQDNSRIQVDRFTAAWANLLSQIIDGSLFVNISRLLHFVLPCGVLCAVHTTNITFWDGSVRLNHSYVSAWSHFGALC